jgi:DNA-binding NarL/FixJ family response regulator
MDKHVIWFIDEDEHELRTFHRQLRSMMPENIEVVAIFPFPQKEEYLKILDAPDTSCLIIDQRLKNTGIAAYTGIELAQYLRGVNKKIPIYILTNFADDDFSDGAWSVEEIISKSDLSDEASAKTVAARLLRHLSIYQDILAEREQRFNDLLKKSLNDELGGEELEELEALQLERTSTTLASELAQLKELELIVERHKQLMGSFAQFPSSEDKDEH